MPKPKSKGPKLDAQEQGRYHRLLRARTPDGLFAPTCEEIAEGAAWLDWINEPTQECRSAYTQAFNALCGQQRGDFGTARCLRCGTLRFGRPADIPCGHCGGKEICVHGSGDC